MAKGQPIGIPGAPYATPVAAGGGVHVDVVRHRHQAGKRGADGGDVGDGAAADPDGSVGPIRPDQGVLVSYQNEDWLVTDTGRHAIDLSDRAVTSAVGIPVTARATPISEGLFNALPNAGPWLLPQVPAAGAPNSVGLPATW